MRIGIPEEEQPGETLVAATPKTAAKLIALGYDVVVQAGAGAAAKFRDEAYVAAGATIGTAGEVWASDVVTKVNEPTAVEVGAAGRGRDVIARMPPGDQPELIEALQARRATGLVARRDPADLPGAVDGRAVHHVQHRRVPRR